MSDRPTYKDYKESRKEGNVIMTPDGSYYAATNPWVIKLFALLSIILFGGAGIIVIALYNGLWLNLMFDFLLAPFVLSWLLDYSKYRLLRFEKLEPGSPEHMEVISRFKPQQEKRQTAAKILEITVKVILTCMFLFALLNTYTAELVRSLFDSQPRLFSVEITSHQMDGEPEVLYSADGETSQTVVLLPATENLQIYVNASVTRTLKPVQLNLDGKPLILNMYNLHTYGRPPSWFWEPEYLKQAFRFYLEGIHDGSTLTLTCGDLHQEWVFDVTDKEAS